MSNRKGREAWKKYKGGKNKILDTTITILSLKDSTKVTVLVPLMWNKKLPLLRETYSYKIG